MDSYIGTRAYSWMKGGVDRTMGADRRDNPYPRRSQKYDQWDRGWFMANWDLNKKALTKGEK